MKAQMFKAKEIHLKKHWLHEMEKGNIYNEKHLNILRSSTTYKNTLKGWWSKWQ